ncbi:MAG: DNA primase [Trueperaceae bacterium]
MAADAKDKIRERLNIADVIGEVVVLKPAGRGQLKGLCPFHSEKTPSFHVHVERGFYYCFGCQAKGDIFDFVMQTQALSFPEALRVLGDRAGVEVTPPTQKDGHRRDLFDVNQVALAYFRAHRDAALPYLEERGLSRESIDGFELGFAPEGWDGLLKHALTKGVRDDDLLALGLVVENERGRRYDRFRNRVMFPIRDGLGRLVGFAGRVLDDALPKYLNSPESDLFRKGELLYALDRARAAIRQSGEVIVVEGYMDVIALHQTGFPNAVAALGATLTPDQAEALVRLDARTVHLAFDADEAGQRAVLGGLDQAVGRRLVVRAVTVPHGKDPADAVLGGHAEAFRDALRHGASEVEFRFQRVLERFDRATLEGQRAILEELQGVLRPRDVFDPVAAEMRRLVIEHLGIDGARLDEWLASRSRRSPSATEVRGMRQRRHEMGQVRRLELEVAALLLMEPRHLRERLASVLAALPEGAPDSALSTFRSLCEEHDYDERGIVLAYRERDDGALVFERLLGGHDDEQNGRIDVAAHLAKATSRLREMQLEGQKEHSRGRLLERLDELTRLLAEPELAVEELEGLYGELQEIQGVLAARDAERRLRVPASYGRQRKRGLG